MIRRERLKKRKDAKLKIPNQCISFNGLERSEFLPSIAFRIGECGLRMWLPSISQRSDSIGQSHQQFNKKNSAPTPVISDVDATALGPTRCAHRREANVWSGGKRKFDACCRQTIWPKLLSAARSCCYWLDLIEHLDGERGAWKTIEVLRVEGE